MSRETGGPSPEEMGIKKQPETELGSGMRYVTDKEGNSTDVIEFEEGKAPKSEADPKGPTP